MQTAAILFRNVIDEAAVTASSAVSSLPARLVQNPHVSRRWRALGATAELLFANLLTTTAINTVALISTNLTAAGTVRVKMSSSDPNCELDIVYDSGSLTGLVDPTYGYFIHLLDTPITTALFMRVSFTDLALDNIEVGRWVAGERHHFGINYAYGWTWGYVDRALLDESRSGRVFVEPDNTYRVGELTFEWLSEAEFRGFVMDVDRLNGMRKDVLLIRDPDSDSLGQDSIWGLMTGLPPIVQPHFNLWAKTYSIRERL